MKNRYILKYKNLNILYLYLFLQDLCAHTIMSDAAFLFRDFSAFFLCFGFKQGPALIFIHSVAFGFSSVNENLMNTFLKTNS